MNRGKRDLKGIGSLTALNLTSEQIEALKAEDGSLSVILKVYDTDTLAKIRMQQPLTYDEAEGMVLATQGVYWADNRYEYSGGDVVYEGKHSTLNAATSDTNWYILKYTYSSGDVTRVQVQKTSWDNRSLGWL